MVCISQQNTRTVLNSQQATEKVYNDSHFFLFTRGLVVDALSVRSKVRVECSFSSDKPLDFADQIRGPNWFCQVALRTGVQRLLLVESRRCAGVEHDGRRMAR